MRLWQKISATSIAVLLLVVAVCGVLLLANARDTMLSMTREQAQTRQTNLRISFEQMAGYYAQETDEPAVKRSLVEYCFRQFADDSSVLINNGETIYSEVSVRPEQWLNVNTTENNSQSTWEGEISGRNVLIVGGRAIVHADEYLVYEVKDITPVYGIIADMAWRFVMICGTGIAAGALLIIFLVRRASKPLVELKKATHDIARGNYSKRYDVRSKDEIGELAFDFNTMADAVELHVEKLKDTAQRQQLFIAGLTHEFKTPMTAMILHSETLLTTDIGREEQEIALAHIHSQCKWLERLTQKMLRLITLDEAIKKRSEDVCALLEDVRESTAASMAKRQTPLHIRCEAGRLDMDSDLMRSLLINLVDNASKASVPGRAIYLRASGNIIEIYDRGAGIPPEEIGKVTDAFYMVDRSRSKAKGGSGLGLALAQKIAEAHGAELVIKSELGEGTTVKIIFPR